MPIQNPFCCFNFFNIPTIYNNFKRRRYMEEKIASVKDMPML